MKKSYLILIVVILSFAFGVGFIVLQKESSTVSFMSKATDALVTNNQESVDYKASFAIFTHGTFRVFTSAMYHNLSKDVFIQANNPNIVHVRKSNLTWDDFFKTLPFTLTRECLTTGTGETFCSRQGETLKFYLNGARAANLLDRTINLGDQALISFGNETEGQIRDQFQTVPVIK